MFNPSRLNNAFLALETLRAYPRSHTPSSANRVIERTDDFGSNPGNLRMFSYSPSPAADDSALVVVLHGCGQTATGYDHGAGWSTLADRYGFTLLMPEQQRSNNPTGCFNWFQLEDTQRGRGEAASIHEMVETMVREKGVDPRRVYITGLSAGGAMTSAMLACYPDVFAAGAIIAGLPYGAASNVQQAFQSMFQSPSRPAQAWGELVRAAAPQHSGPWPRVSVWHGSADKTVIPSNAFEIVKQWTDVHGLSIEPATAAIIDGFPRQVWQDTSGKEILEFFTINHMAHGTPLSTGEADNECGAAGPFLLEVGISSSFHIATFFGLTTAGARPASLTNGATGPLAQLPVASSQFSQPQISRHRASRRNASDKAPAEFTRPDMTPRVNIGAVIAKALEAAGLMRRR